MKALITLNGVAAIDKPKSLLNVEYEDEKSLIDKLKEMQSGYSVDGKDKPKIERHTIPSQKYPGKTRKVIDCSTYADWHHVAHLEVYSDVVPTLYLNPKDNDLIEGRTFEFPSFPGVNGVIQSVNDDGDGKGTYIRLYFFNGPTPQDADGTWDEYKPIGWVRGCFQTGEYSKLIQKARKQQN